MEMDYQDIHDAALGGSLVAVQKFLQQGIDINIRNNNDGQTPLHCAVSHGHLQLVEYLLGQAVDPNIQTNFFKKTALLIAVEYKQISIMHCLLKHGANPNLQSDRKSTPLHEAIRRGDAFAVYHLLSNPNIDSSLKEKWGKIPLRLLIYQFETLEKGKGYLDESYIQSLQQNSLRCLYAFLLKGIHIMQNQLFVDKVLSSFRPKMQLIVEEAKAYIQAVEKDFGILGKAFFHCFLLSSREEKREFSATWFWLQAIMKRYNATKSLKSGQWPLELSIHIYQCLWKDTEIFLHHTQYGSLEDRMRVV